jgi:hypothetical protein
MQKLKVTEAMNKLITSAIHRLRMTTFILLLAARESCPASPGRLHAKNKFHNNFNHKDLQP